MNKIGWLVSAILLLVIFFQRIRRDEVRVGLLIKEILTEGLYKEFSISLDDKELLVIGVKENLGLTYLSNYANGYIQKFHFHENGMLGTKTKLDTNGIIQDGMYYFFKSNGNLSHNYNYVDDKKVGVSKSYHSNSPYLREYMEYDSLGRLYYRKTYDELGNTIKEEGE